MRVTFGLVVLTWVMVTWDGMTGKPFNKSLVRTLLTAAPPLIPLTMPASATASIGTAATVTVNIHCALLPLGSVDVHVTVVVPEINVTLLSVVDPDPVVTPDKMYPVE